eukprot:443247-Pleurochrysis_carterae.AAC.4
MIVHDDEGVAAAPVNRRKKRSCKVDMYESSRVRRSLPRKRSASRGGGVSQTARGVGCILRETLQVRAPTVETAVREVSSIVSGHDKYMWDVAREE